MAPLECHTPSREAAGPFSKGWMRRESGTLRVGFFFWDPTRDSNATLSRFSGRSLRWKIVGGPWWGITCCCARPNRTASFFRVWGHIYSRRAQSQLCLCLLCFVMLQSKRWCSNIFILKVRTQTHAATACLAAGTRVDPIFAA